MTTGHRGESCAEAIRSSLQVGEIVMFSELFRRVRPRGEWKDDTLWQHLIGFIVNLPPARHHWNLAKPLLFLHEDGQYELYDPQKHPKTIE